MGKAQTTDIQRIVQVDKGTKIVMESTVTTAVKYGDKFRPVMRRTLLALGDNGTDTRVITEITVVFIGSVNSMIKSLIVKSVIAGVKDNVQKMEQVLSEYAPLRDYTGEEAVAPAAAAAAGPPPPPSPTVPLLPKSLSSRQCFSTEWAPLQWVH